MQLIFQGKYHCKVTSQLGGKLTEGLRLVVILSEFGRWRGGRAADGLPHACCFSLISVVVGGVRWHCRIHM